MMPPPRGSPKAYLSFKRLPAEDSGDSPTFPTPPLPPPSAHKNLFNGLAVGGGVIFVGIIIFAALMYWLRRKDPAIAEEDGRRSEEEDTGEEHVVREVQVQSVEDSSSS